VILFCWDPSSELRSYAGKPPCFSLVGSTLPCNARCSLREHRNQSARLWHICPLLQGQNPTSGGPGGLPATVAAAQALRYPALMSIKAVHICASRQLACPLTKPSPGFKALVAAYPSAFPSAHPATIQVPDRRSIAPAGLPGLQLGSSIGLDLLGGFQLPGNLQAWLTAAPLGQIAGQGQQGSAAPLTGYLGTLGAGLQGIAPGIVVDTSSSALLAELLSAQAANATNGGVGPAGAGAPRGTLSQSSTRALDFSGQLPGAAPGGDAPAGGKPSGLPTRLFQQEDAAGSQGATTTPKAMLEGVGSGGLGNISAPNSGGPQPARRTRTLTTASGLPGLSSATPSQPPNGTSVVTSQHGTGISAMLPPLSGGAGRSGSGRPGDDWQGAGGGGGNRRTPPPSGYLERRAGSAAASDSGVLVEWVKSWEWWWSPLVCGGRGTMLLPGLSLHKPQCTANSTHSTVWWMREIQSKL
jgi:hypothetical protein